MCGFIGFFSNEDNLNNKYPNLRLSFNILSNRGPDAHAEYLHKGIYMGFRRLSIIDPQSRSNQPFQSKCGNFILCFNGEIYNYKELSEHLKNRNIKLKTTSDTEVILELYLIYKEQFLNFLRGMFAIMIYDKQNNIVFFARDHFGIKPLYYHVGDGLVINSQVKSIISSKLINKKVNPKSRKILYLMGSIAEPLSYFENINSVKAGEFIEYHINEKKIIKNQWFNLSNFFLNTKHTKITTNDENTLKNKIIETINSHCIADTEVGLFYSNGLDSNLIYQCVKKLLNYDLKNFSINFNDGGYNEIKDNKIILNKNNLFVNEINKNDLIGDIDNIFQSMDQPSIDGTNVWYASKLAKENGVKAVLSGLGADELFNGYSVVNNVNLFYKNKFLVILIGILKYFIKRNKDKLSFLDLCYKNKSQLWLLIRSFIPFNKLVEKGIFDHQENPLDMLLEDFIPQADDDVSFLEFNLYLKNQLLRDCDWASMAHGIEVRVPFVDIELLKVVSKFHLNSKYKGKVDLYSKLFGEILPQYQLKYKKKGFKQPQYSWYNPNIKTKEDYISNIEENYLSSLKS